MTSVTTTGGSTNVGPSLSERVVESLEEIGRDMGQIKKDIGIDIPAFTESLYESVDMDVPVDPEGDADE